MIREKTNRISLCTIILLFLAIIFFGIIPHFSRPEYLRYVISWDVFGYYLYLPAAFIRHDLALEHFDWVLEVQKKYEPSDTLYQLFNTPHDGVNTWVIKYAMGAAILYSPFFFISHFTAGLFGYPAEGFSIPYQIAVLAAGYFYTLMGLLFFRKILLRFFTDQITAIVIFLIIVGTNFFEFVSREGTLSHNLLFFINAVILYLTVRWHENPKQRFAFLLGMFIALASITRPLEIAWIIIPIFWGVGSKESLRKKIYMLWSYRSHLFLFAAGMFLIGCLQMLYWKKTTGHYIYYTYTEEFYFLKPFILNVLFSYKKGWLLYTPLMIFALIGFVPLFKIYRNIFLSSFLCFVAYLYLISCFEGWWYSGSFSNRALLETYVLLGIPLGSYIQFVSKQKKLLRNSMGVLFLVIVALNVFQTWQYTNEIIDKERMTKEYYWAVFLKTSVNEKDRELLEVERTNIPPKNLEDGTKFVKRPLEHLDFSTMPEEWQRRYLDTSIYLSPAYSLKMDSAMPYAATYETRYSNLTVKDYAWVKVIASIYIFDETDREKAMIVTSFKHKGKLYNYKGSVIQPDSLKVNQWNKVVAYYMTPIVKSTDDSLQVYAWYNGKNQIRLDDFSVEVFEPR